MNLQPGGWFFKGAFSNKIHELSAGDMKELLKLADEEDAWCQRVKEEAEYFDKHPGEGGPVFLNQRRIMNISGATVRFPYGDIITFNSRRHFFRGENQQFAESVPSLNRKIKFLKPEDKELYRAVANMRVIQFSKWIWKINVIPYWEAKLSDVNYKALAQHYGFATHLLDLTNDFRVALFFATCSYDFDTDSYKPLRQKEIEVSEQTRYGMVFHSPNWVLDFINAGPSMEWFQKHVNDRRTMPYELDSGDLDGMAFQIGYQPFVRCHHQSGYLFPMRNEVPLQQNSKFEKMRFRQSEELSNYVYELMDGGKRVFPHEGIGEALEVLRLIQKATVFSQEDVACVYEQVDKAVFPEVGAFKQALKETNLFEAPIQIVSEEVIYPIKEEKLTAINERYDDIGKIWEPIGEKLYTLPECRERRRQRCIQIYGHEIE